MCKKKDISLIINEMMRLPGVLAYIDDVNFNRYDDNGKFVDCITSSSYRKFPEVVFDAKSFNFHIFPSDSELCQSLSKEYTKLRTALLLSFSKKINSVKNDDDFILEIKENFEHTYGRTVANYKSGSKLYGPGAGNTFTRLSNVLNAANIKDDDKYVSIYKYIEIYYNRVCYTLNFMRYTCNEEGKVGCTMRAIQFHKGGFVNKGANGFDICYPKNDKNGSYCVNSAGNICYNPHIEYPGDSPSKNQLDKIINYFINFIKIADNIEIKEEKNYGNNLEKQDFEKL